MSGLWLLLTTAGFAADFEISEGPLLDTWIDESALWPGMDPSDEPEHVVGGEPVKGKRWKDTVGVVFWSSYVGCTGTLVHPRVVLTAGHCADGISHVIIGSKDWATDDGDELIAVAEVHEYNNSQSTYDAAVLVLDTKSKIEPRAIAIECILDDYLADGSEVTVVGFGGTRADGGGYNSQLNEGVTYVQDHDCDSYEIDGTYAGCQGSVSPGGELGAGGNGVDSCFGDSGGPLYLNTPVGDYVVGITSRAYAGVSWDTPCLEGGIYVRPDAILDWAEEVSGKTLTYPNCNAEPTLWADTIYAPSGGTGDTFIDVDDPDGKNEKATFAIVQQPEFGTAEITETGQVLYTANAGYTGSDTVTVSVTDAARAKYPRSGGSNTLEFDIPIEVSNTPMAAAPGVEGETDTTTEPAGCGCQSTGTSGGLAVLLAPLLVALRRRKRSV